MLVHRIYYLIKPLVPWRLRIALRRIVARSIRDNSKNIWPIDKSSCRPPDGWPGWPEGKKFAFVITHDVEGPKGLAKCRQLAELEMKLGFRSSFNFIPEGDYRVPSELRDWLSNHGFEIGIHDFNHDGKLFDSPEGFRRKAWQINHYAHEWKAVGFRAGFMFRNLDWYHQLDVQYDASTFDTDPFEPQPDGAGTIFPFWIPSPDMASATGAAAGAKDEGQGAKREGNQPFTADRQLSTGSGCAGGYVELPYTLPQDSTLFLLLQEKTPEIWLRKLDWVAAHGGMALVNVHPDYMNFGTRRPAANEFGANFYVELLQHVATHHAGQSWTPLPRELASWYKTQHCLNQDLGNPPGRALESVPENPGYLSSALRGKRTAVLLYSHYPSDARPRRAAEFMIEAGMEVDLFCLSESADEPREEVVNGVRIFRLPLDHSRGSKWAYFLSYSRFIFSSFLFLARRGLKRKYDLVHVHNMPDVLVFSTWLLKIKGVKVLLDLHDPMPELMMTIYQLPENRLPVRVLKLLEKWSIGFADGVITVNLACQKLFSSRSCLPDKVSVIMNSPDEDIFPYREPARGDPAAPVSGSPFVIMYHGSLLERHGLDLAVAALGRIRQSHPRVELRIYGRETPFLHQVLKQVTEAGLQDAVHYLGSKSLEQIVEAIRDCDVGIIPNRRSLFTEINTPTRIFEYLSQGKPVIAPRAPGILDYFGAQDLYYFQLGDADDLSRAIDQVIRHPAEVEGIVRRGQAVYLNHRWHNERHRFHRLVADFLEVEILRHGESLPPGDVRSQV